MRTDTKNSDPCGVKAVGPNFKHFVLGAQKELRAQISVVHRLGIKVLVLGICCTLSCDRIYTAKNFDWNAFEAHQDFQIAVQLIVRSVSRIRSNV